jgi:hypothetical protein
VKIRKRSKFWAGAIAGALLLASLAAAGEDVATAVFSKTLNGYKRVKLADGTFKPESYVLTDGGVLPDTTRDNSQEKMSFVTIARVVEKLLAQRQYLMADDLKSADLLLVVHWGRTITFDDVNYSIGLTDAGEAKATLEGLRANRENSVNDYAAFSAARAEFESQMLMVNMANEQRDRENEKNARLLGYKEDMDGSNDIRRVAMVSNQFDQLRAEIEQARYFVVISAFALPLPADQKKQKLLWSTRVSIRSSGNNFGDRLPEMIASASRFVGLDTKHLVRQFEGHVEMGELKVIGVEEEPAKPAPPAPPAKGQ